MVAYPLTMLDICTMSDGAAVAILASEEGWPEKLCDNPVQRARSRHGHGCHAHGGPPARRCILLKHEDPSWYKNLKYPGVHSLPRRAHGQQDGLRKGRD